MACHAGDESPDLLEVLHAASKAEAPELELLRQADLLQWPVLAVLAASHPDASASRCMAAWLRATLQLEGRPSAAHTRTCTLETDLKPERAIYSQIFCPEPVCRNGHWPCKSFLLNSCRLFSSIIRLF